jgi:3'-phosphoadenosine 5'-phosphosulfate sulfotransferase (PAPS reductase)/FAD synthetase
MTRIVCWFSCGAASAVATKLAIADNAGREPLVIAYTEVANEHPDNKRFLKDCERWFGQEIIILRNERYNADIYEVFEKRRFLVGPNGAPCTTLLKRQMRVFFEEEDDTQVFGFTVEEVERAAKFKQRNSYVQLLTPLIDRSLTKGDCWAMLERAGIEIPAMYKLGYRNNNCIGCVKGGAGYWNKIRVDFPDQFARMAKLERSIGHSIIKNDKGPVFLDEMPTDMGVHQEQPDIECSFFCHMAEQDIAA